MRELRASEGALEELRAMIVLPERLRDAALAFVAVLERWCEAGLSGIVLLVEEPELFLRPQAQRYLHRLLHTFAAAGNQVLFSTHSPAFLSVAHLEELARLDLITGLQRDRVAAALDSIAGEFENGVFVFSEADEDLHGAVERRLIELAGDRRVGAVIERVWEQGQRFDGWSEHFSYQRWVDAAAEVLPAQGVDLDWYTTRERAVEEVLPWDHISAGLHKDFLWQDWQDALAEVGLPDCRWTPCYDCGACTGYGIEHVVASATAPAGGSQGTGQDLSTGHLPGPVPVTLRTRTFAGAAT